MVTVNTRKCTFVVSGDMVHITVWHGSQVKSEIRVPLADFVAGGKQINKKLKEV